MPVQTAFSNSSYRDRTANYDRMRFPAQSVAKKDGYEVQSLKLLQNLVFAKRHVLKNPRNLVRNFSDLVPPFKSKYHLMCLNLIFCKFYLIVTYLGEVLCFKMVLWHAFHKSAFFSLC